MSADPRTATWKVSIEASDGLLERIAQRAAQILTEHETHSSSSWVSTRAAAEHLCCPLGRIYDLVQLGKLNPQRDGRRLLFRRQDLDDYLEEQG
jgi:excisionase family DNA binding protein